MTSFYGLNIPLLDVLIFLDMLAILQMRLQLQVVPCRVRHSSVLAKELFKAVSNWMQLFFCVWLA